MKNNRKEVQSRNKTFSRRPVTTIWQEDASEANPYQATSCRCHGYDHLELLEKRSFVDVFFLLLQGELPSFDQAQLLERLMISMINPGPRHPAARAAMVAGASKTAPSHLLPLSLTILAGSHLGGAEVEQAMLFLVDHSETAPEEAINEAMSHERETCEGDWHPAPGFGSRFGGLDLLSEGIAQRLVALPGAGPALRWGNAFAQALHPHGMGWLPTGLAAAAFCDLGFDPKSGAGLFQLLNAPGLLAHGAEFADKPMTAIPFPTDEEYFIERD